MSALRSKLDNLKDRNLWIRVFSASILVVVTLICTIMNGVWFAVLAAMVTAAMAREWVRMSDQNARIATYVLTMGGMVIPVFLARGEHWNAALLVLLGVAAFSTLERLKRGTPWRATGGVLYIGLAVLAILYLRAVPDGLWRLLYLFAVVWSADSAAYLVGSRVRGPKLWPSISPNKTWSGFAAGVIGGTLAGSLAARLAGYDGGLGLEVLSAVLSVISVGGDLLSSWLKRRFGVKDTGTSIPGHGGVLDRLDALLAASMALAAFMLVFPGLVF